MYNFLSQVFMSFSIVHVGDIWPIQTNKATWLITFKNSIKDLNFTMVLFW